MDRASEREPQVNDWTTLFITLIVITMIIEFHEHHLADYDSVVSANVLSFLQMFASILQMHQSVA